LLSENRVDNHLTYDHDCECDNKSNNGNICVDQTQLLPAVHQIKSDENEIKQDEGESHNENNDDNLVDGTIDNNTNDLEEMTNEIPQDPGDTIEDESVKTQRLREAYIKLWAKLDRVKRLKNMKNKKTKSAKKQNEKIIAYIGGPCDMSKII